MKRSIIPFCIFDLSGIFLLLTVSILTTI